MPKAWITLTVGTLKSSMTVKEVADFAKLITDSEVPSRVEPILASVVQRVRGAIKSCSQNTVSADDTKIPAEFEFEALAIARYRLLTSIPGYPVGKDRKEEHDNALLFLKDVAKCVIRPEEADDAVKPDVPQEEPHATPRMCAPPRRFSRRSQDGI